jgi:FtsP/CotA-like multicopper oxidase with cupredoxin domain
VSPPLGRLRGFGRRLSRRDLLVGGGLVGASAVAGRIAHDRLDAGADSAARADAAPPAAQPIVPGLPIPGFLDGFERGALVRGRRRFSLVARDATIEVAQGIPFNAWTYNGNVPGPTLRAQQGERIDVHFHNDTGRPHTVHFHGIHGSFQDGVPAVGGGEVQPGGSTIYRLEGEPFGLHLYHCHSSPLDVHMARGLYGAFIIDPAEPREAAHELVFVLSAFDLDGDDVNDVYALNGRAFGHVNEMIEVRRGELVRIYVVNTTEYDLINSVHVHANFFHVYPSGTAREPTEYADTWMMCQGQRAILELRFRSLGRYMVHAHQSRFTERGWAATVHVS